MVNAELVIGANYGDEGKGLFTEFLSKTCHNPIVVLANGGSQRGHTVNDPVLGKHVFHHFGSGTLAGRPTFFAGSFLLNPMQFAKEHAELTKMLGHAPVSFRAKNCYIQFPFDIALNWHVEKCRGERKHGSVGCGIWETTNRVKYWSGKDHDITFERFVGLSYEDKLTCIKDLGIRYVASRCDELGITKKVDLLDIFMAQGFLDHFIADTMFMAKECQIMTTIELGAYSTLIFENGQGLMLDQFYGCQDLANTTPSYTGSIAIAQMLQNSGLELGKVHCNYISRTYLTKHGAGTFKEEVPGMKFEDKTNVFNEWQDAMRFGELDLGELKARVDKDFDFFKKFCSAQVTKNMVFTHANEVAIDLKNLDVGDYMSQTDRADGFMRKAD